MAPTYFCENCKTKYPVMTPNGCCSNPACFGEPLTQVGRSQVALQKIEGLCILVCDASYSMSHPAFPESSPAEKLILVCGAIQKALVELEQISKPDEAFIGIVGFAKNAALIRDKQNKPFLKSVKEISNDFNGMLSLGRYIYDNLSNDVDQLDRKYTDISAGLALARKIYDSAVARDLSEFGIDNPIGKLEQKDILCRGKQIGVPNIRVLAYSDGGHNSADNSPLVNPFINLPTSPLMTAFIGDPNSTDDTKLGSKQMLELATVCPEHEVKGYFEIASDKQHAQLRDLFKMASGASGFCPSCIAMARQI